MTTVRNISLCLKCGIRKGSPASPCPGCGHVPLDLDDRARHLLIEARNLSEAEANEFSAGIAAGRPLEFSEDSLLTMKSALSADRPDPHWWLFYGLIVAVPILAFLIWLLFGMPGLRE